MQITNSKKRKKPNLLRLALAKQEQAKTHGLSVWQNNQIGKTHSVIRQFSNAIYHRRLFVLSPFFMLFGIVIYKNLSQEPQIWALVLIGIALLAMLLHQTIRGKQSSIILLCLALFVGFSLLPIHGKIFGTQMLKYPMFGIYQAKVIKVISNKDDGQRVVVSNIEPIDGARTLPIRNSRLFVRKGKILQVGDIIKAKIRFASVPGPIVIGGYDSQFHSYFAGIGAFGTSLNEPEIIGRAKTSTIKRFINNMQVNIGDRIGAVLSQPALGIAQALIVGDQTKIDDETRKTMANAGLAHMLAISGLHLSLVAGGAFAASRLLFSVSFIYFKHFPVKKISAIVGILVALFYLSLSGASVSATRATIMLVLIFGAIIVGKKALTMRNVAFAGLFVILTDPAAIFRPSFQLSFAAVVALIAIYELVQTNRNKATGFIFNIVRFFIGLSVTSLIAGLATAIFALYHFQQSAPLGVLGNLAGLPILTFIVLPAGFIAMLLIPVGLETIFLEVMGWGIERILNVAYRVTSLSEGINFTPLLLPNSLVFTLFALAFLAFFTTRLRLLGPIVIVPLIALFGLDRSPDILIANSTKAIAVRGNPIKGETDKYSLALISGRTGSFATNVWQDNYQEPIGKKLQGALCDETACFYNSPLGFSISLVNSGRAGFFEDCPIANLVITRLNAPQFCKELTQVIDKSDLQKGGVHWLAWQSDKQEFIIRPAITKPSRAWRIIY